MECEVVEGLANKNMWDKKYFLELANFWIKIFFLSFTLIVLRAVEPPSTRPDRFWSRIDLTQFSKRPSLETFDDFFSRSFQPQNLNFCVQHLVNFHKIFKIVFSSWKFAKTLWRVPRFRGFGTMKTKLRFVKCLLHRVTCKK